MVPVSSSPAPLLSRVALRNYRSIEECDVELRPLTYLVGPNGSGKSNFLDALRLVVDALTTTLDHALRDRGGIQEVRRRSAGHPTHFGIRLDFALDDSSGHFAFEVAARPGGTFAIKHEECVLGTAHYDVREGSVVRSSLSSMPPAASDRLYLVTASGLPEFRRAYDALSRMGFYSPSPEKMRELQTADRGDVLKRDASNIASVLTRLDAPEHVETKDRIRDYLARVVPGITGFDHRRMGHMETFEVRQLVEGATNAWKFPAINMSDGTLRALAVLVALFQPALTTPRIRLIGIEEPETSLHPAAAGVLRDCIAEASRSVQVVVTSHSADLLDDPDLSPDVLRAVEASGGRTTIGAIDAASREALREKLYTAGDLLRAGQLAPDVTTARRQLNLFGDGSA